jgi:four helix bundle protein
MAVDKTEMINRYKKFTVDIVKFCSKLPKEQAFFIFGKQLIRCSSSMGANYRAACRGKSTADFINKLKIVEEEADETVYWLEIIEELLPNDKTECTAILSEAKQLVSIVTAALKTMRNRV